MTKRPPVRPILIKATRPGWFIISPPGKKPRSLSELQPAFARNMIRQHNGRDALRIFGPYHWAEELVRRHKAECKKNRRSYRRDEAIDEAADAVGLDCEKLRNWMNRSRSKRSTR